MGEPTSESPKKKNADVEEFFREVDAVTIQAVKWGRQKLSPYMPAVTELSPSDPNVSAIIKVRNHAVVIGAEIELDVIVDRPMKDDAHWDYVQLQSSDGVSITGTLSAASNTVKAKFSAYSTDAKDEKFVHVQLFSEGDRFSVIVSPFWSIWETYPSRHNNHHPCELINQGDQYSAQCAMRLTEALEAAQISTASFAGGRCWSCSGTSSGRKHILRAQDLATWIDRHRDDIGAGPKEVKKDVTYKDYTDKFGLVYFKDFWARNDGEEASGNLTGDHIDIWNGSGDWHGKGQMGSGSNDDYGLNRTGPLNYSPTLEYFKRSDEVWFWPLH